MKTIRLEKVSKIYNRGKGNEFTALREVDLSLSADKTTVFTGPSGAGKTTILSIIGCVTRPTTGRIWIDDRETTSLPERFGAEIRRSTFGFVFQNYHLIRGLTVLENTMIPAYPTGRRHKQVKQEAEALLASLGMEEKARQKVELLSGGERQRAAIARALINDPEVIVADEPTAHLDTERAMELMDILDGLKRRNKTVLISSHDPLVFESPVVDRVVRLRDGAVLETETFE